MSADVFLKTLTTLLEEEIERQETILSLSRAQNAAAKSRSLPELQAKTDALELLTREANAAQKEIEKTTDAIANALGVTHRPVRLTDIINAAPTAHARRLRELQQILRDILQQTKKDVRANTLLFRTSLAVVSKARAKLESRLGIPREKRYDAKGRNSLRKDVKAAVFDHRG